MNRQQSTDGAAPVGERISSDAVLHATGRGREEWFRLLDEWGAVAREHREIASWLARKYDLAGWWSQSITVDYEQARGLREPGQRRGAGFEASASKTVKVAVEQLYAAFMEPAQRERWLGDAVLRERTSHPNRSARFDWGDGATRVTVGFSAKGEHRSQVAVTHERLPDARAAEARKQYWRERLAALQRLLEQRVTADSEASAG